MVAHQGRSYSHHEGLVREDGLDVRVPHEASSLARTSVRWGCASVRLRWVWRPAPLASGGGASTGATLTGWADPVRLQRAPTADNFRRLGRVPCPRPGWSTPPCGCRAHKLRWARLRHHERPGRRLRPPTRCWRSPPPGDGVLAPSDEAAATSPMLTGSEDPARHDRRRPYLRQPTEPLLYRPDAVHSTRWYARLLLRQAWLHPAARLSRTTPRGRRPWPTLSSATRRWASIWRLPDAVSGSIPRTRNEAGRCWRPPPTDLHGDGPAVVRHRSCPARPLGVTLPPVISTPPQRGRLAQRVRPGSAPSVFQPQFKTVAPYVTRRGTAYELTRPTLLTGARSA